MVNDHYSINENTTAFIPSKHVDYETTVLEKQGMYHIRKKPLELIEDGCTDNWTSYNGRRSATIVHTGYQRKVPIIINIQKNIIAFPTQSPTSFECYWLFAKHIEAIEKQKDSNHALVILRNYETLPLTTSFYTLKKQYERTMNCLLKLNGLR